MQRSHLLSELSLSDCKIDQGSITSSEWCISTQLTKNNKVTWVSALPTYPYKKIQGNSLLKYSDVLHTGYLRLKKTANQHFMDLPVFHCGCSDVQFQHRLEQAHPHCTSELLTYSNRAEQIPKVPTHRLGRLFSEHIHRINLAHIQQRHLNQWEEK